MTWSVWDSVEVEAKTLEDAIQYVKDNIDEFPLGTEPKYIDGSYCIGDGGANTIKESADYIKRFWDI